MRAASCAALGIGAAAPAITAGAGVSCVRCSSRGRRSEVAEVDGDDLAVPVASPGWPARRRAASAVGWAAWSATSPWPMPFSGSPWARISPRSRRTASVLIRVW